MEIVTLTLNPAFDVHCRAEGFQTGKENFGELLCRQSGGKGVNVSRALEANGIKSRAVLLVGEENGAQYLQGLSLQDTIPIALPGRIRENITVHHGGKETRLSFPGFTVGGDTVQRLEQAIPPCDHLILSGSLPHGISTEAAAEILCRFREKGVRVTVDCRSFSPGELVRIRPWLIKPNRQEFARWTGGGDLLAEAEKLHRAGIENVLVSLGAEGAVLVCGDGAFSAEPPKIEPRSTIGAGDSAVAGFVTGQTGEDRLRRAVAFGTAACLTDGTLPPEKEQVSRLLSRVRVRAL